MQPVIIEQIDGVVFETPYSGPAVTKFWSKSEDHRFVMKTVVEYCDRICSSLGFFDFTVSFNIASCPNDYIQGRIKWSI